MIRRALPVPSSPAWVLISQVEHARLAGVLAERWGNAPFARLEPREELVAAVYRHDDGWAEWEQAPQVDPETGRPRDFTEMEPAESLVIWRKSVDSAAGAGPLAAHVVSGHFCALLRRFSSHWRSDASRAAAALAFLNEQGVRQTTWLDAWRVPDPSRKLERAARALAFLQMFDVISLWLCCAERDAPETFEPPGGPALTFRPDGPTRFGVTPWPFTGERVELEVTGRRVPERFYSGAEELAQVPAEPVKLVWELEPSGG